MSLRVLFYVTTIGLVQICKPLRTSYMNFLTLSDNTSFTSINCLTFHAHAAEWIVP